jgi:opacity protein-like surface antigen
MRAVTLSISVAALALCLDAARLPAQQPGGGAFQWYIGGSGGILNFKTQVQGYSTIPMAGAQLLVKARRTGLMLSVEEGFGSNEVSTYTDGAGGTQVVTFDDIRKYSATLMAFPLNIPIQPYLGIGVGLMHVVEPSSTHEGSTAANELGSTGFGSLIGGVQFKLARFVGFGQYQITTGASIQQSSGFGPTLGIGRLIEGPTHTFSAGLRIGLGNARERATGGGY